MTSKNASSNLRNLKDFYIGKHRNPYIVHFKVTKIRNFNNFREIIHELTLFLTLCSVVWRKKCINNLRNLTNGCLHGKHWNPYIVHFKVTKPRDFRNFLKIIHKLTSFLTLCCVVWRQKTLQTISGTSQTDSLHRKTSKYIYWPFSSEKNSRF